MPNSAPEEAASCGPLAGLRVVELAGIGPGPYACMLLADMGADIVTIVRPGQWRRDARLYVNRGRRVVELDLKRPEHAEQALKLIGEAEVLVEGFRPLVMERLGLGPEAALARNPRLVYARMTGWGQDGALSQAAGHDITYIAITGALDSFRGTDGAPIAPLNLVGDYGGGALFLIAGVLAAVIHARSTGTGQVVDAAICDGVASMLSMFHSLDATGRWSRIPRQNLLDGGAHFYRTYACKDGRHFAVGAIEPAFYARLKELAQLDEAEFEPQMDDKLWPQRQERLAEIFLTKTRDEWAALLEGTDACAAPVLALAEAPFHPHLQARATFIATDHGFQPAPAPRFSRTPSALGRSADVAPVTAEEALERWTSADL
jgi:alpha-methylacyl-CoA racemase